MFDSPLIVTDTDKPISMKPRGGGPLHGGPQSLCGIMKSFHNLVGRTISSL